jgi:hypothetical protein
LTGRAQWLRVQSVHDQPSPAQAGHHQQRPEHNRPSHPMWVLILEMLVALALLLFIVWWTMFAGRRRGERRDDEDAQ